MLAALTAAFAGGFATGAVAHQRSVDRPIGEGALFATDGAEARARLELMMSTYEPDDGIRHLRNQMRIEAVSLVNAEGTVVESTSANLVDKTISNRLLLHGLDSSRLTALARTLDSPVMVDGVVEWAPGDVLYEVLQPMSEGGLLLAYDMTELLQRRARPEGIDAVTLQMLGAAALLGLVSLGLFVGRSRLARRNRQVFAEAQILHRHSAQLQVKNQELLAARTAAEEALALAEEKIRIRADFVLMINHELRTPLTSIVTGAELLGAKHLADEERTTLVADMVTDGRRLESIISQMLEVARVENRGLSLAFAAQSVEDICRSAADTHQRIVHAPADNGGESLLWTNETALLRLIGSLADNAVTHGARTVKLTCSNELPIEPSVEAGTRPHDAVYLTISDDGPGIDPAVLPHIFEKFKKQSFSSGTGLGLYLATLIVDALGASLSVFSSPAGTSVVIAVPKATVSQLAEVA